MQSRDQVRINAPRKIQGQRIALGGYINPRHFYLTNYLIHFQKIKCSIICFICMVVLDARIKTT